MDFQIQSGSSPYYRFCYFEDEKGRFFADMVNLNEFIGVLVPLPRLLPAELRIFECDEQWQFDEMKPIKTRKRLFFNDQELITFITQWIKKR